MICLGSLDRFQVVITGRTIELECPHHCRLMSGHFNESFHKLTLEPVGDVGFALPFQGCG